jgi:predicted nucleotidyltransferase
MYSDKDIDYLKDIIIEVVKPQNIILFGSYAYGDPKADSDLDFLVIKEPKEGLALSSAEEFSYIKQINKKQREKDFFLAADIFALSSNDVEQMQNDKNSALFQAVRKGRVLYAANDEKSRAV